jgi:hypothetical protein
LKILMKKASKAYKLPYLFSNKFLFRDCPVDYGRVFFICAGGGRSNVEVNREEVADVPESQDSAPSAGAW